MSYTYHGIVFSLKKECNFDTCYNWDELWRHCTSWNNLVTEGPMLPKILLQELSGSFEFIDMETTMTVVRSRGESE